METYPLIQGHRRDTTLGWHDNRPVSAGRFLADAFSLSKNLPNTPRILNLCNNRYRFLVGFSAALIKGQTNILPPNKSPKGLQSIASQFPEIYCLTDNECHENLGIPVLQYPSGETTEVMPLDIPQIASSLVAAMAFTSGSTGTPQVHSKTWGSMVKIAHNTSHRLIPRNLENTSIVATVPPQHMYGLETSIMLPLQHNIALHGGHPFFPEDIREALASVPKNRILVTTPVHLKACVKNAIDFPEIAFIVSATAPLSRELAETAEQLFDTDVFEIYGCTEAGSLATRQTTRNSAWKFLDGITLTGDHDQSYVEASYLPQPVKLPDIIKKGQNGLFELQGRGADLINIGGKRTSLGELNHHLNEIKGVEEGTYFVPSQNDPDHKRLIAFVVTKNLRKEDILQALRQHLDPVFLPRPIYLVDHLPRTSSGKLTRENLLEVFSQFVK